MKGGASVPLAANEKAMEKANPMYNSIYSQIGQYWGEQPGTSGPVYVGAFVMFLFVLGLFIVKGPMKWALLSATVLSVLLSWGKNFIRSAGLPCVNDCIWLSGLRFDQAYLCVSVHAARSGRILAGVCRLCGKTAERGPGPLGVIPFGIQPGSEKLQGVLRR